MSESFVYTPANVCSREFRFLFEEGKIKELTIVGGCPGNTTAVSRLVVGKSPEEVISLLQGISCPGSRTHVDSCPDQLARALKAYLARD